MEDQKDFPKLSSFAFWHGNMIYPQWLELSISRINFYGPKDVRAIEIFLLYTAEPPEVYSLAIAGINLGKKDTERDKTLLDFYIPKLHS